MNAGSPAKWAGKLTTRGIIKPAHTSPRCSTPANCRRRVKTFGFICPLGCADGVEHRQDDIVNKRWMEEPKSWQARNECDETPALPLGAKPKPTAKPGALEQQAHALNDKVDRGQPITAMSWQRDHELVQRPGDEEHGEESHMPAGMPGQRLEQMLMHQVSEGGIPTPAPKLAERGGGSRGLHYWPGIDAKCAPEERKQMEKSKVEEEDHPNHPNPGSN